MFDFTLLFSDFSAALDLLLQAILLFLFGGA